MSFKTRRIEINETYIEVWFNNVEYCVAIGDTKNIQNQYTVYRSSSETEAVKRFIALSNSFREILG